MKIEVLLEPVWTARKNLVGEDVCDLALSKLARLYIAGWRFASVGGDAGEVIIELCRCTDIAMIDISSGDAMFYLDSSYGPFEYVGGAS